MEKSGKVTLYHRNSNPYHLKTWTQDLQPAPWLHWKCLNILRTGMGRCKSNMLQWKYSDAGTICDFGEQSQTMDHLLKYPMLLQECTTEDLMEYNEAAKKCVFRWMSNV